MKQFVEGEDRSFREGRSPERRPVLSARGFPVPHGDLSRGGVAVVQQRTTPSLAIRQVSCAIAEPASPRGNSLLSGRGVRLADPGSLAHLELRTIGDHGAHDGVELAGRGGRHKIL